MSSPIRYLTGEHLASAIATGLQKRSIDAITVADAGLLGAEDETLLAFAQREQRVIVTRDPDFLQITDQATDPPGVVFRSRDFPIGETVRMLDLLVQVSDAEEMVGRVEYL